MSLQWMLIHCKGYMNAEGGKQHGKKTWILEEEVNIRGRSQNQMRKSTLEEEVNIRGGSRRRRTKSNLEEEIDVKGTRSIQSFMVEDQGVVNYYQGLIPINITLAVASLFSGVFLRQVNPGFRRVLEI
jgi:DNA-directed RNA polymerase beta' subunit